jgi:organic hydroperoxide reductase OsmC/OhrA
MTARNGSADWHGDVQTGSGTITVGDGVFSGPYSYDSRFGERRGTNPEQLIAAAQAGCFTMALASTLASGGHPPDLLRTNATVRLRMHGGRSPSRAWRSRRRDASRASTSSSSCGTPKTRKRPAQSRARCRVSSRSC